MTLVRPGKQHNHSHHLPQTRHRQTVTACSHRRLGVACPLRNDQTSRRSDANRPRIETCMEATWRDRLRDTLFRGVRLDSHTATMARLSWAASRFLQTPNPTNQ